MKISEIQILKEAHLSSDVLLTVDDMEQMVYNADKVSFGIMSWEISGATTAQNNARLVKLLNALNQAGLKHWFAVGVGQEMDARGEKRLSEEHSVIILGPTLTQMKRFAGGAIAKQFFFIYDGPESNGNPTLYKSSGEVVERWSRLVVGKGSDGYTVLPDGNAFRFQ